jgi:hypothetical protein
MRSLDGAAVSAKARKFDSVLSRTRRIDKQSAGRAGLKTSVFHDRYLPLLLANDLHSCALGNGQEALRERDEARQHSRRPEAWLPDHAR